MPLEQTTYDLVSLQNGLTLVYDNLELCGDFTKLLKRTKPGKLQSELLVKAAKIKHAHADSVRNADTNSNIPIDRPLAIDATAGLGEDSFLLAAAGFDVVLFERNQTIAALLEDALIRAQSNQETASIVSHMTFKKGDSITALQQWTRDPLKKHPDIVLLDPMFPERTKSASVKKKLQLFQELEAPCNEEELLLQSAFMTNPTKIIIKRPAKGPYLANIKPSYSISGKAVRYDVIVTAQTRNPFTS